LRRDDMIFGSRSVRKNSRDNMRKDRKTDRKNRGKVESVDVFRIY
jgi:hypothetical protein